MMRGIDSRNEIDPTLLLRIRERWTTVSDFLSDPSNVSILIVVLAAVGYYVSEATFLTLIIGRFNFCLFLYTQAKATFSFT